MYAQKFKEILMQKKTLITLTTIVGAALVFAGCAKNNSSSATSSPASANGAAAADQKTGTTSRTGKVIKVGEKYFLEKPGTESLEIDSYTLDLANYMGKTVTVTGQYSGNTLFVGSIQ
jgi:hypothetical protein